MAGTSDRTRKLQLLTEIKVDGGQQIPALIKGYNTLDKTAEGFSKRVDRYFSTGEKAAEDARRSVQEMQQALAKANEEAGDPRSVQVVRSRAAAFRDELEEAQRLLSVQEQRVQVEEQINATQRARPAAGGPDTFQAAGDVSSGLSAAAQLLPGGAGNTVRGLADIAGLVEYLPRLSQGLQVMAGASTAAGTGITGMVAALGPIALAAGAATVGFALIKKSIDEANQEVERRITITKILIGLEHELTTQAAKQRREELEARIAQGEEEMASIQRLQQEQEQFIRENSSGHELDVLLGNLLGTQGLGGFKKDLEATEEQLAKDKGELEGLNQLLDENAFAANDAAEAEKRLAQERTQATIAEVEAAAARRLEAERLKAEGTSEQIEARLDAISRERAVIEGQIEDLESLVGTTEEGRAEIKGLQTELANLNAEERLLKDEVVSVVAARERETEALQEQKEALETAQQKARDIAESQKQFNASLAALEEQTAERREQIIQQSAERILEIETRLADSIEAAMRDAERADDAAARKLDDDIAKVEQEAADQEIELREETADRINELERRAAQERQRILRDYNRAASKAIQDRDAVALDAAKQTRDDALKDQEDQLDEGVREEKESLKKRLEEQKRSNEQRLRDLRQSYEQERREREIALQQKLADLRQNAADEIETARVKQAQALSDLRTAYDQQRQVIINKFGEQFTTISGHYEKLNDLTATKLNQLYNQWAATYNDMIAVASGPYNDPRHEEGVGGPGGYARGVRNAPGGWRKVGEEGTELMYVPRGADIYSHGESMQMLGGKRVNIENVSVSIVTQSTDARGIMREVRREFPNMMADALAELG